MSLWEDDSLHNNNDKENGSWFVPEPDDEGNMSFGQGDGDGSVHQIFIHIAPNTMMYTASMILGILTVATAIFGTVYLPFIFGGLAIVTAILSRGEDGLMTFKAKLGVLIGSLGIILNIVVVGTSVYTVFHDPEQYAQFDSIFERVYGENFETFTEELHNGSGLF